MTSKEAVRKLKFDDFIPLSDLVYRKGIDLPPQKPMYLGTSPDDCWKVIEDDLEVLEILKSILKVKKSDLYGFEIVVRGNEEQENIIKEWLENDK